MYSKRILDLTGAELVALFIDNGLMVNTHQESEVIPSGKQYVYGMNGLAKLLNCSKVTAQKYKNNGLLDGCYYQIGRKLIFDAEAIAEKFTKQVNKK